jgi:hypothetical protein
VKKVPLLLVVAALGAPGTAAAARQGGIVVKVDRQAHVVAVAQKAGRVVRVHAPAARFANRRNAKAFRVGQRLSFAARRLRNGTLAGRAFRVTGRANRTTVHGTVRAYNARKRMLAISAGGTVLRMKLAGRRTFMSSSPPPKVGSDVDVTVALDDDKPLEATQVAESDDDQAEDQQGENDDQQADDDQQGDDDQGEAEADDDAEQANDSNNSEPGGDDSDNSGPGGGDDDGDED